MTETTIAEDLGKRNHIRASIKLVLTDDGINHFIKGNQKLHKYQLSDDSEYFGMELRDFAPKSVQRMICFSFVSAIELPVKDSRAERKNIIDIAKLISFGLLYRQFDTDIWNDLSRTRAIKAWNRQNPRIPLDYRTPSLSSVFRRTLLGRAELKRAIVDRFLVSIASEINMNEAIHPKERKMKKQIAERFVENLGDLSWFVLTTYWNTPLFAEMENIINEKLRFFIRRSEVGEYTAMLIIELLSFFMAPPAQLIKRPEHSKSEMSVLWKIRKRRNLPDDKSKLNIIICDRSVASREANLKIYERANMQVKEKSLNDFYRDEGGENKAGELGLYYLSYLKDACRKLDINFEPFVTISSDGGTLVNLGFTF